MSRESFRSLTQDIFQSFSGSAYADFIWWDNIDHVFQQIDSIDRGTGERYTLFCYLFAHHLRFDPDAPFRLQDAVEGAFFPAKWYEDLSYIFWRYALFGSCIAKSFEFAGGWVDKIPLRQFLRKRTTPSLGALQFKVGSSNLGVDPRRGSGTAIDAIYLDGYWHTRPTSIVSRGARRSTPKYPDGDLWVLDDPILNEQVVERFRKSKDNWRQIAMWFTALDYGNLDLFDQDPFPDTGEPTPPGQFEQAFDAVERQIAIGDVLLIREIGDRGSTIIARGDKGSWSHRVHYAGNGDIIEVEPPRSRIGRLSSYKDAKFRFALFRWTAAMGSPSWRAYFASWDFEANMRGLGQKYDYRGAAKAAISSFFWAQPAVHRTPNALVRLGSLRPIVIA